MGWQLATNFEAFFFVNIFEILNYLVVHTFLGYPNLWISIKREFNTYSTLGNTLNRIQELIFKIGWKISRNFCSTGFPDRQTGIRKYVCVQIISSRLAKLLRANFLCHLVTLPKCRSFHGHLDCELNYFDIHISKTIFSWIYKRSGIHKSV